MRFFFGRTVATFSTSAASSAKNVNSEVDQHKIANADKSCNINFNTVCEAECFEVCQGMIKTRCSEVFWKELPPVPLPEEIIQRFAGKTMAVVGCEVDQMQQQKPMEKPFLFPLPTPAITIFALF